MREARCALPVQSTACPMRISRPFALPKRCHMCATTSRPRLQRSPTCAQRRPRLHIAAGLLPDPSAERRIPMVPTDVCAKHPELPERHHRRPVPSSAQGAGAVKGPCGGAGLRGRVAVLRFFILINHCGGHPAPLQSSRFPGSQDVTPVDTCRKVAKGCVHMLTLLLR